MRRSRKVQLVGLLCCAGLVYVAAQGIPAINAGREALNILGSASPIENTPPEYVFYIQALGAFRGLIADIAFIRAEQFKEEGRFFDAMQLHKWICAFQPHFPTVWEYAAWNMSWNISVTTYTAEERWNWVYNGIKLLRDQGIPFNPRAINLYKQLAWTFNNKIGEVIDEYHYAYKCNWAWRMHLLLGPPREPEAGLDLAALADEVKSADDVDLLEAAGRRTFEQNQELARQQAAERKEEYAARELKEPEGGSLVDPRKFPEFELGKQTELARLRPIAAAPRTVEELYQRHPEARRMVAELRPLGIDVNDDTLTEDAYWGPGGLAHAFFQPYRRIAGRATMLTELRQEEAVADEEELSVGEQLDRILGVRTGDTAGAALVHFLQRKVLLEVYKLDPEKMIDLVRTFGPVDWRAPDAHSLYWTIQGLVAGGETVSELGSDKTNTARNIFHSLRNLFLFNRMVFEPYPETIQLSYLSRSRDLRFVEVLHQAYMKYGPLFDPDMRAGGGAGSTYRSGHINLLTAAIRSLYMSGREREAARYYEFLRREYPMTLIPNQPNLTLAKSLHDYVMDSYLESAEYHAFRDITLLLADLLTNAYSELANGNATRYARLTRSAREFYDRFVSDKQDPISARLRPPPFSQVQVDIFGTSLAQPALSHVQTLHKVRLWRRAPLYLRQPVYDVLLPRFQAECEVWNFDLAKAFPEPVDMEAYRKQRPARRQRQPGMPPRSPSGEGGE